MMEWRQHHSMHAQSLQQANERKEKKSPRIENVTKMATRIEIEEQKASPTLIETAKVLASNVALKEVPAPPHAILTVVLRLTASITVNVPEMDFDMGTKSFEKT